MNKKKWLLTLAIGMMLGGCGSKSDKSASTEEQLENDTINKTITDTMLVIGVWNQPKAYGARRYKCIAVVDKKGAIHQIETGLNKEVSRKEVTREDLKKQDPWIHPWLPYIERGDTVYVENGRIVKNLTMERMAERYVKGR